MVNSKIRLTIFFAAKDGEALYSQQKQDQELTAAQSMNSLLPNSYLNWRKWGKTTRQFSYDLNQIPYDSTVEMRNRFKGLRSDSQSAWWTMDGGCWHCTGDREQDHSKEKEKKSTKQLSSFHTLGRQCSNSFKLGFSSTWMENSVCKSWI